jgi:adenylate kinase family enzyme
MPLSLVPLSLVSLLSVNSVPFDQLPPRRVSAATRRAAGVRLAAPGADQAQAARPTLDDRVLEPDRATDGSGKESAVEDPATLPPPRSFEETGYRAPDHLRTWAPFTYASPEARRRAVREWVQQNRDDESAGAVPSDAAPIRMVLLGGPSSGKGTIGPMLSQAFRLRMVGAGALFRGEVRARTERGRRSSAAMARGELLPDAVILDALNDCLDCYDVRRNGWLLDGFPRTVGQVEAVLGNERWAILKPDLVLVLDRPDELVSRAGHGGCGRLGWGGDRLRLWARRGLGLWSERVCSLGSGRWRAREVGRRDRG